MFYALGVFRHYCCPNKKPQVETSAKQSDNISERTPSISYTEQTCPYPDLPTHNPSLIREDGTYIA